MSLYRCAACGSPNVVIDTQKEGYDYVKGAIGTVVLGVGGAAAGINGKTKQVYKCPDCGLTLNEPMAFEIKTLIDIGVMSPSARSNLKLAGVPVDWQTFTRKYKNIEKDTFVTESSSVTSTQPAASAPVKPEKPVLPMDEMDMNRRVYKVARASYVKACEQWVVECEQIKKTRDKLIKEQTQQEKDKLIKKITDARDYELARLASREERTIKEKAEAEAKLASLGFFKMSEKRETKKMIEKLTQDLTDIGLAIHEVESTYDSQMAQLEETLSGKRSTIHKAVYKKHPCPKKPELPNEMRSLKADGSEATGRDLVDILHKEEIFRFIEENGFVTYAQIKDGCTTLADYTDSRVRTYISELEKEFTIMATGNKYGVIYVMNPEWSGGRLLSDEDLNAYEEYQRRLAEKREKAKRENEEMKNKILSIMKGKGKVTIGDVRGYSSEFDTPKTAALMMQLARDGVIKETEVMRRKYYEYQ